MARVGLLPIPCPGLPSLINYNPPTLIKEPCKHTSCVDPNLVLWFLEFPPTVQKQPRRRNATFTRFFRPSLDALNSNNKKDFNLCISSQYLPFMDSQPSLRRASLTRSDSQHFDLQSLCCSPPPAAFHH